MKAGRTAKRWVPLLAGLMCCLAVVTYGQMNTADMAGTVTDPTGAIIPHATVVATQIATQQKHTTTSNDAAYSCYHSFPWAITRSPLTHKDSSRPFNETWCYMRAITCGRIFLCGWAMPASR